MYNHGGNLYVKKAFKAQGAIKITKAGKSISLLFEVVRREEDWQKKLADKMAMYKEFYANFVQGDSGFSTMPLGMIVVKDDKYYLRDMYEAECLIVKRFRRLNSNNFSSS